MASNTSKLNELILALQNKIKTINHRNDIYYKSLSHHYYF